MSLLTRGCFTSTETVGLLGTGAQDVHLDVHTSPELKVESVPVLMFLFVPVTVSTIALGCVIQSLGRALHSGLNITRFAVTGHFRYFTG